MENDIDFLYLLVEVSVTVYVFLLGLPVLVNQIFLPEDLRRMSKRNYTGQVKGVLIGLSLLLLAILWLAYPKEGNFHEKLLFPGWSTTQMASYLFIIMLLSTAVFLYRYLVRSQGYRARIIDVIRKKIIRQYRREGVIDQDYMDDLRYLGKYSKAGSETRIVIEALDDLLHQVTDNYHDLIIMIDILCDSVTNTVEPGSRQNMVEVLTIFKKILMDLSNRSAADNQVYSGNEERKIKSCISKIALTSLKQDYADMMPLVLNVLTLIPGSSDELFDIGKLALNARQYKIAISVLSEIMDRDNEDDRTVNNYYGLIAHFHFDGNAARQYAHRSLKSNGLQPEEEHLKKARRYHFSKANFTTADLLDQLLYEPIPGDAPG